MTAGLGRTLTYTSYNMPAQVVGVGYSGGASTTYNYVYNAEHERTKLVHSTLGTFIYLHPAGKGQLLYEKQTEASPSTRIEHKYYISAGGMSVAVHYARENPNLTETTTATRYLHQDHLGSITLITNEAGGVTERLAYEAYGKRRYPAGTDDPTNGLFGQVTDRGFTSHEHLDEIALIHMNGRVYDPVLGRFVTADPFLQDPGNLQSYNRYSYVLNNPLMYTDPTGYFSFKKLFRAVAAVAIAVFAPEFIAAQYAAATTAAVGFQGFAAAYAVGQTIGVAVAGFASGWVAGGNFESGLHGMFSAGLFNLAAGVGAATSVERVMAHAAAGCVSSSIGGGRCGSGALSAGVAKFATGQLDGSRYLNDLGKGIAVAVIGGTASVIGGGKFENGAATAAFGYLFNELRTNGYRLSNPAVIRNLEQLNQAIIDQGYRDDSFQIDVTGGDRYRDAQGRIRSSTNNQIVRGSAANSAHLIENGARAVDLSTNGVPQAVFDRAIRATDFDVNRVFREYPNAPHIHIQLSR